jgi:hypothetical protein
MKPIIIPFRRLIDCVAGLALGAAILVANNAAAARISDIKNTKHNLSVRGPGDVKAAPTSMQYQICVFCHTPHGATLGVSPLWNRKLSSATYQTYTSLSLDAIAPGAVGNAVSGQLDQPGGSSKLCLSCHDGTLAIGNVNVMFGLGTENSTWEMPMYGVQGYSDAQNLLGGKMPFGGYGSVKDVASAVNTGYTRYLGIDLTNDHPISVTYTADLAARDGELRDVDANQKSVAFGAYYDLGQVIGIRSSGYRPEQPLESTGTVAGSTGQIQCGTCHDPHLRETDSAVGNQMFLRLNRFQERNPPTEAYNGFGDISCVACHDKNFETTSPATKAGTWAYSVHANPQVSDPNPQTYTTAAAEQNGFPTTNDGASTNLPMWKASCLNCHDTHTVQGARWLLREGTDSTSTPKAGGNSAIEETCYQCHSSNSNLESGPTAGNPAKDIEYDFASNTHMPITLVDQQGNLTSPGEPAEEIHDIGGNFDDSGIAGGGEDCTGTANKCGADGVESRARLGLGNLANRHAECTDCHNPHRTVKFQSFEGAASGVDLSGTPDTVGTHKHDDASGYTHTNVASGALRGTYGVEPTSYYSDSFEDLPTGYDVKRGDPDSALGVTDCANLNKATCDAKTFVTREYQICLKCHSDYGYEDDQLTDADTLTRPPLGSTGLTAQYTNGLTHYTNQAREFQAPSSHRGEGFNFGIDGGAKPAYGADDYDANNHRSWHPVMDSTGRDATARGGITATSVFTLPWSNAVGDQTMYCSDCHGSNVSSTTSVVPDDSSAPYDARKSWGPHGSSNNFILKGTWDTSTGSNNTGLCFKCHDYSAYATGNTFDGTNGGTRTGFWTTDNGGADGHALHASKIGYMRCDWCHTAVPHGWKNKAMLVNLNDVGLEVGVDDGSGTASEVRANTTAAYSKAPYYLNAVLKIKTFAASGQWTAADCGSSGKAGNGQSGLAWMKTSNENCTTPP